MSIIVSNSKYLTIKSKDFKNLPNFIHIHVLLTPFVVFDFSLFLLPPPPLWFHFSPKKNHYQTSICTIYAFTQVWGCFHTNLGISCIIVFGKKPLVQVSCKCFTNAFNPWITSLSLSSLSFTCIYKMLTTNTRTMLRTRPNSKIIKYQ